MPKRKVAALEKVQADLAGLQYKMRRDPEYVLFVFLSFLDLFPILNLKSETEVTVEVEVDADCYTVLSDYEKEFLEVWNQYEAAHDKFLASSTNADSNALINFHELVDLIAHVADLYPQHTATFAPGLKSVLVQHHASLEPELREKLVSSLVLLRRKNVIDSSELLPTLFPILISTGSKTLRMLL